ncbi:MAG: potassium-transporting ATPase subunit C [Mycolicibacterium sp.]|nr:potassium-transporting ATPase subunit C [Mycolicibacterium sp.]
MFGHVRANLWLVVLSLLLCCVLYPLAVLGIARAFFPEQAEGSLIGPKGEPVTEASQAIGSRLIAQPFSGDEYFHPRPSAVSFNAAASGATNWGANNYLLRDRVARILGPIVKYRSGPKKGQLVAPDIESWFQKDQFQGRPGIVAQWAQTHNTLAQNWVKADQMNGEYVAAWQKAHPAEVSQWIKDNPDNPEPKPEDLAVPFFISYSATYPGTFPSPVEHKTADGQAEEKIEPVKEGSDIQSIFFDMWRQEHPDADLEPVPADMVMATGSGLDPDITLKNALYQLDRVAGAWAKKTNRDEGTIRREVESVLNENATAPLGGLAGVKLINVLEMNLALRNRYGSQVVPEK